ncbi:MAG: amino acid-binding protein [Leptospiraceae bacterium]|nr:amino acid-binding protein [Leptospiraceae bacterium]MCP5512523.1 amino acid-binding protein [Leptospiraceae bacterium]
MIEFNFSSQGDEVQITLKTDINQIGTFHKMVAVIYKYDWDILSGDIKTIEEDGRTYVYDILRLKSEPGSSPRMTTELGLLMETVFSSDDSILENIYKETFSKKRTKSFFHDQAELIFEDDQSKNWTEMYIEADSGKGFLFYLTKILRENSVDIISAEIETDLSSIKACDTFYLRDGNGFPFADKPLAEKLRNEIIKNL